MSEARIVGALIACLLLIAMAAAALLLFGGQEQAERQQRRLAQVSQGAFARESARVSTPRLVQRIRPPGMAARLTALMGYDLDIPDQYPIPWWAAGLIGLLAARIGVWLLHGLVGAAAWIGFPIIFIAVTRGFFLWCRRRRRDLLFRQFPDALAMIVRAVRVGIPLAEGIRTVGREGAEPTATMFRRVAEEVAIGVTTEDALKALTTRSRLPEYRFFATALALQNHTGGGLSETLTNLADVIRRRVAVRARGKALAAEARTSAAILAVLPVITVLGLLVLSPGYIVQIFTTPLGHKLLGAAVLSEGFGIAVMRFMIVRSLS